MAQLPRRHQILNNSTITGSGNSGALSNLASGEGQYAVMVFDITGTVSGGGTLTVNVYANITGQRTELIDSFTETAQLTAPVRHVYNQLLEDQIYVSWSISGGSSPSFGGVYMDILFPSPNA